MTNSDEQEQTPSAQDKIEPLTKWERFIQWLLHRTWSAQSRLVFKRWGQFLAVISDPWTIFLVGAIWWLFVLATKPKIDPFASTLLFTMQTLLSAVAGGRVAKSWADLTDPGVLGAKGLVAVRSLKLVLRQASSLESRVESFKSEQLSAAASQELVHRSYDEIIDNCRALQDQTTSSIENWIDIVPEARVLLEQDAAQSALKTTIDQLNARIAKLTQDVQEGITQTDEARTEQESLRAKLTEAQASLAQSRIKLSPGSGAVASNWSVLAKIIQQAAQNAARSAALNQESANYGLPARRGDLLTGEQAVEMLRNAPGESNSKGESNLKSEMPADESALQRKSEAKPESISKPSGEAAAPKSLGNDVTK